MTNTCVSCLMTSLKSATILFYLQRMAKERVPWGRQESFIIFEISCHSNNDVFLHYLFTKNNACLSRAFCQKKAWYYVKNKATSATIFSSISSSSSMDPKDVSRRKCIIGESSLPTIFIPLTLKNNYVILLRCFQFIYFKNVTILDGTMLIYVVILEPSPTLSTFHEIARHCLAKSRTFL